MSCNSVCRLRNRPVDSGLVTVSQDLAHRTSVDFLSYACETYQSADQIKSPQRPAASTARVVYNFGDCEACVEARRQLSSRPRLSSQWKLSSRRRPGSTFARVGDCALAALGVQAWSQQRRVRPGRSASLVRSVLRPTALRCSVLRPRRGTRSERSEFRDATPGRAPQGSRRVQRRPPQCEPTPGSGWRGAGRSESRLSQRQHAPTWIPACAGMTTITRMTTCAGMTICVGMTAWA